jgi:hypothetical protein
MQHPSLLLQKIEQLRALMHRELGASGKEVGALGSLATDLSDDERVQFFAALKREGYRVEKLYSRRTWRQFWQWITMSAQYVPPRAVFVRQGYETLEQIANQNLRFNLHDYRQGLWPPEAIEARVKQILAHCCAVPVERIKRETTIRELENMCC